MAVNEWKIWQKLGLAKKPEAPQINVGKDADAILLSLKEASPVIKELADLFNLFKTLRLKEARFRKLNAPEKDIIRIIEEEVQVYDQILQKYEFYELEVDVNAERIKNISTVLGKAAKDAMISQKWLEKIRKSERWIFDW